MLDSSAEKSFWNLNSAKKALVKSLHRKHFSILFLKKKLSASKGDEKPILSSPTPWTKRELFTCFNQFRWSRCDFYENSHSRGKSSVNMQRTDYFFVSLQSLNFIRENKSVWKVNKLFPYQILLRMTNGKLI